MRILLAGGAGYIGSHTAVSLLNCGHEVIIIDNYSNSNPEVLRRIEKITGKKVMSFASDVRDKNTVLRIMKDNKIDCVMHFAGLKSVGESVRNPVKYYRNNIDTTLTLLECMEENNVKNMIFSSSATVYGESNPIPHKEKMIRGKCSNPYGWTKFMIEQILEDAARADKTLSVVLLRYFNPVGAHPSGLIGEDPKAVPNNLMPFISQVAVGRRAYLTVFGNDYATPDGTCRRDYIHIMDLAEGHVKAVQYAFAHKGCEVFNLGTGVPYSVLEMVKTFEKYSGKNIPYKFGKRRPGDIPDSWADVEKAERILGWKAVRTLEDMCRDAWNWQKKNPQGYNTELNSN